MGLGDIWNRITSIDWHDRIGELIIYGMTLLCVAGTVHIAVVFLVPRYAPADGWTRISPLAPAEKFALIDEDPNQEVILPGLDPLFIHAACRVNLDPDPFRITLSGENQFWTMALYDRRGTVIFSLNSSTTAVGDLNMLVVNAAQNAKVKENPPEDLPSIVLVESRTDDMIALLRIFTPDERDRPNNARLLEQAGCDKDPLDGVEDAEPVARLPGSAGPLVAG